MSGVAHERAQARRGAPGRDWTIRAARAQDAETVAAAVGELLLELGGQAADPRAMEAAVRELVEDPQAGAVLLAENADALVGVLGASWQTAIHVPGRYALIQDLWVHRGWRGRGVGGALLAAVFERARAARLGRVEVGLPRESFAGFRATEAFYLAHGFASLGPRMRQVLT